MSKEKKAEYNRRYYEQNKQKVRELNKQKYKAYYAINKEKLKSKKREYMRLKAQTHVDQTEPSR